MRESERGVQVTDGGGPRWRLRTLAPLAVCAAAIGLSCWGNCPPVTTAPAIPMYTLRPRYVLVRVGTAQTPPAVLVDNGTIRVRLLADTLTFTPTDSTSTSGTYTEAVVLGVTQSGGAEVPSRTSSSPRPWTRSFNTLTLSSFTGGGASTSATANISESGGPSPAPQMYVFSDLRSFGFEAR